MALRSILTYRATDIRLHLFSQIERDVFLKGCQKVSPTPTPADETKCPYLGLESDVRVTG